MKYSLGLDIGITSVGWAVLENNEQDEPFRVERMGVRIFDKAEHPKNGASLAMPRRDARGTRRRLRRRKHRTERIKYFLIQSGLISWDDITALFENPSFEQDIYELRVSAIENKLTKEDWARLLLYFAKHRGYQSNSKAEEGKSDSDAGKVLTAIGENRSLMQEKGYRTIGEMLLRDDKFYVSNPDGTVIHQPRNKAGQYLCTVERSLLVEEIKMIFARQRELGDAFATETNEEKYLELFLSQRSFDEGPGGNSPFGGGLIEKMLGNCTFEPEEKRAAKATYSFEYFRLLQSVNHLRICREDTKRELTPEERKTLIDLALKSENLTYDRIRKALGLSNEETFDGLDYLKNYPKNAGKTPEDIAALQQSTEKGKKFKEMVNYHKIRKALGKDESKTDCITKLSINHLDNIGTILTLYKSDDIRIEKLTEADIPEDFIERLLPLSFSKAGHLSLKALKKITPYLEQGMTYDKACSEVYGDFRKAESENKKTRLSINDVEEIGNPVVLRAVSQTIKVVNAITDLYGAPQVVRIELAREMGKNFQDRQEILKHQKENRDKNDKAYQQVLEYKENGHVTSEDMLKFRLYQEQDGHCAYTFRGSEGILELNRLFEPGYVDIDHIIPYSISFDDSIHNKVLVKTTANREKGNRLPYQYFGQDEDYWGRFETFVDTHIRDYRKRQKLLKKQLTDEDINGFKERNLNDTKYITRVMYNMFRNHMAFAESEKYNKKRVFAVNGIVTSMMRKQWGFPAKLRVNDLHHALDAAVIACISDGMIQKLTRYTQNRETEYLNYDEIVDIETGEIIKNNPADKNNIFPVPWEGFRRDVLNYVEASDVSNAGKFVENQPKFFVSHMPQRKVTGAAHQDTIRSGKINGYTVSKVTLDNLKLDKNGEIENYFNPCDDLLLYNALKERLLENGGSGKNAFKEPFYKPKADGTPGPLVKKVKRIEKASLAVPVMGGIASNGSMVRIDVYYVPKDGYYAIPIYVSDTVKPVLPNIAVVGHKNYDEWKTMEDKDFIFSLYPGDLIKIVHKNGIKLKAHSDETKIKEIATKEEFLYYVKFGISTASITAETHDGAYGIASLGIKTLQSLEKYEVDVLGNVHKVKLPQKRMGFKH